MAAHGPGGIYSGAGATATTTYYANGLVKSQTDVVGNMISYTYDPAGRVSKEVQPVSVTAFAPDAAVNEGAAPPRVYARGVGGAKPSPQRSHLDFNADGQVVAQGGRTPKGMSTYDSLAHLDSRFPSSQPAYYASLDALPEDLGYALDGGIDGLPEGHIYPKVEMSFSRFTKRIKGSPWTPVKS